ncbi:MAG: DUF6541 family protein [Microbacterium sp.]
MNAWIAQLPAFAGAFALLLLPGLPAALLLRLQGVARIGAAVALSLAAVGGGSLIAPMLGIGWSLWPVIGVAAVITVLAVILRLLGGRGGASHRAEGGRALWIWGAIVVSVIGWAAVVGVGIGEPDHPNQLYDAIFHLNAVEFILRTGDASPLHMTMVAPGQSAYFYPTLWHAFVSLLVPLSGAITAATNVATIAFVALIWPVALATITQVLFPKARVAVVSAPLLGFCFAQFPLGFLNWGVLYPNLLGMLLSPLLFAFVLLAGERGLSAAARVSLILLVVATAGATAIAHPSALLGVIVLLLPWGAAKGWRAYRVATSPRRWLILGSGVVLFIVLIVVWTVGNVSMNSWKPGLTLAQAVGEIVFLSPVSRATGLLLGPLAVLGVVRLLRERRWWPVATHAVAAFFFLICTWLTVLPVRTFLVGVWYDDTTRVAALLAILGIPLAALGASEVWDWIAVRREAHGSRVVVIATVVVLALASTHLIALRNEVRQMRNVSFVFSDASGGLSPDEVSLFEEANRILDAKSRVIGDPLTGTGLLFAYTGHAVVFPHVTGGYGADAALLAKRFRYGGADVCEAVQDLGVTHAMDFGDRSVFTSLDDYYEGLRDLERSPILTEVAEVGDATLYRVTGCD